MPFKIVFPVPYQVTDIYDDNIDVNIVLSNGDVYFATLFTLKNIRKLLIINSEIYFWFADMLIVEDLSYQKIHKVVETVLNDGYFEKAFSKIGTISTVYSHHGWKEYADVNKIKPI
jgi:hypothetical protein